MRADKLSICGDSSLKLWMIVIVSLPGGGRAEAKIVAVFGIEVIDGDHTAVPTIEIVMELPFPGEIFIHFEQDMTIGFDFEFSCPVPVGVAGGIFGRFAYPDEDKVFIYCGEIISAGERGFIFTVFKGQLFASGQNGDNEQENKAEKFLAEMFHGGDLSDFHFR